MAIPAPNLDDRGFQDLVDDAKRLVQQRCPEWTDHNVHDPGVTLIETFAYMTDQLFYRLNRVPDRMYVKFLDLIGVSLLPPTAARTDVTFWLSGPRPQELVIPAGTEVSNDASEAPIVFATADDLVVVPVELEAMASAVGGQHPKPHEMHRLAGQRVVAFGKSPKSNDAVLFGLSSAAPANVVVIRMDCQVEGVGVDPTNPPLVWEALTPSGWLECEVESDGTGGLNRPGDVVLYVPKEHATGVIVRRRAGWIRCRLVAPSEGQAFYSASPTLGEVSAFTIGGTVVATHSKLISGEILGISHGLAGQRFTLRHPPVLPDDELVVQVGSGDAWEDWEVVPSFADSTADSKHVTLDATTGEVSFGPAVRDPDGSLQRFGAIPRKSAVVRVPGYRTGGGRSGNVARGELTRLRSEIKNVNRVVNRHPATGGRDGESVEAAKIRGPLDLRHRERAVTAQDYEVLARRAAPGVARVRCVEADTGAAPAARVLVVPEVASDRGRLRFEDLVVPEHILEAITRDLDHRRMIGTRILVEPPSYQGVTIVAKLTARSRVSPQRLASEATEALYQYFNPLTGGPAGTGWPFGRPVQAGEVYGVLQGVRGTEMVDSVVLFAADPVTRERGAPTQRIDLDPHSLVFSFGHSVRVMEPES